MKLSLVILSLFLSSFAFAGTALEEKFLFSGANYVTAGSSLMTSSAITGGQNILTRSTAGGKNFYLTYLTLESLENVVSATGARLGSCSLQIPAGTTVATWNFANATNEQVDRVSLQPALPLPISASMAVSCAPNSSTATIWSVNYGGFEY